MAIALPPHLFIALSYLINNPAFMPIHSKDVVMESYRSFIKVLPLQKNNEPILVQYAILYNTNEANHNKMESSNQNRIQRLLLDKLLSDSEL